LLAFIRASSVNDKIPMNDDGIQLLAGTALGVLDRLVRAGHYLDDASSSLTDRRTPYVDAPTFASLSAAQRAARRITLSGEAVFAGAVESIGDSATVGLTLDLSF
jgi:hypothetical protein